jgi:hypothetical protein
LGAAFEDLGQEGARAAGDQVPALARVLVTVDIRGSRGKGTYCESQVDDVLCPLILDVDRQQHLGKVI